MNTKRPKLRVSTQEIHNAIEMLSDCIDKKCLGQGDGEAVITLIKHLAYVDCDIHDFVDSKEPVVKAIMEGYEDA